MSKYVIQTLGCKANWADSQNIEKAFLEHGWSARLEGDGPVDVCVVNSCTVTDEADRQSRKLARQLAKQHPGAKIVMTGCGAEVDPEGMAAAKGVQYVVGNQDKTTLAEQVIRAVSGSGDEAAESQGRILGGAVAYSSFLSRHPMDREWAVDDSVFSQALQTTDTHRTRAFLKIQEGCNAFCTYCIIPYGRGPSRSLSSMRVVEEVQALVAQGFREVVLTATNLGDFEGGLTGLVKELLSQTKIERIRLSSLDPVEIEASLMELMRAEPRVCAHFHVSLQSPHSRILRLMKRKYRFEEVESCLRSIAALPAPHLGSPYVGMDVITGFPGESLEEFEWGVEQLRRLPWTRLHVFPYSERKGTPATKLAGSVPVAERKRRSRVLQDLSFERLQTHLRAQVGCELRDVLVEAKVSGPGGVGNWWSGTTSDYLRVWINAPDHTDLTNKTVSVQAQEVFLQSSAGDGVLLTNLG